MRAVVQRVTGAEVSVAGERVARIGPGLLVLLGIAAEDGPKEADWLADKILTMRIFANAAGKFDLSVEDVGGGVLVVSQFTLYADTRRGRRPSFVEAAAPARAEPLYERFVENVRRRGVPVTTGRFGARMQVRLVNDGPVTLLLESPGEK